MACNSIFYKFLSFSLSSRFFWILSYKCSCLFYNIPTIIFIAHCVYMEPFREAIKAIEKKNRRDQKNVICRKVSAENCHSFGSFFHPLALSAAKVFLSSFSWGSERHVLSERGFDKVLHSFFRSVSMGMRKIDHHRHFRIQGLFVMFFYLSIGTSSAYLHTSDWVCLYFDILIANWFLLLFGRLKLPWVTYRFL